MTRLALSTVEQIFSLTALLVMNSVLESSYKDNLGIWEH